MNVRLIEQNEDLLEQALRWRYERDEEAWRTFSEGISEVVAGAVESTRRWLWQAKGVVDRDDLHQEALLAVVEWVMSLEPPILEPLDVAAEVERAINRRLSQVRDEFARKGARPGRSTRDARSPKSRYPDHLRDQLFTHPCFYRNPASCIGAAEILAAVLQECETEGQRELVLLLCEAPSDQELGDSLGVSADTAKHMRRRFQAKIAHLLVKWGWAETAAQTAISPPPRTPILKQKVQSYEKPCQQRPRVVIPDDLPEDADQVGECANAPAGVFGEDEFSNLPAGKFSEDEFLNIPAGIFSEDECEGDEALIVW
jgi:hypothetical protein